MKVQSLDAGCARHVEFHATLVIPTVLDEQAMRKATRAVLDQHQPCDTWTDILRGHVVPLKSHHDLGYFRCRTAEGSASRYYNDPGQGLSPVVVDSETIDKLFLESDKALEVIFQRAFVVRAILFADATMIRFKFQHVLGDITGLFLVMKSFCAALHEENLSVVAKQKGRPLSKKIYVEKQRSKAQSQDSHASQDSRDNAFVRRHKQYFVRGFPELLRTGFRTWHHAPKSRPHCKKTVFIPQSTIESWAAQSSSAAVKVTENDLLMGWLQKALMEYIHKNKFKRWQDREHFAFIMNIQRGLTEQQDFANPYMMVPVPADAPVDAPLSEYASQIRATIIEARQPGCIEKVIEQHRGLDMDSLLPRHQGTSETPFAFVTTWAAQPFYDLRFPDADGKSSVAPVYMQGYVEMSPLLRAIKIPLVNQICCWKGRQGGYWLEADLETGLWEMILQF